MRVVCGREEEDSASARKKRACLSSRRGKINCLLEMAGFGERSGGGGGGGLDGGPTNPTAPCTFSPSVAPFSLHPTTETNFVLLAHTNSVCGG